jgi:hypothetical protein
LLFIRTTTNPSLATKQGLPSININLGWSRHRGKQS